MSNKNRSAASRKKMTREYSGMQNQGDIVVQLTHICAYFERDFWNLFTVFCGQSNIILCNRLIYHASVFKPEQIDASPISGVSRINAKLWHCSRELKIGLVSIFLCSHTDGWYVPQLHNKILACLRNMGAERPLFRICHPNPCVRKIHPKMGCVLREHCFGWQIRNTGSSAPILRRQSCLGGPVGRGYRLPVSDIH